MPCVSRIFESIIELVRGILRRFYLLLIAFLVDPFDVYNLYLGPSLHEYIKAIPKTVNLPSYMFPYIFIIVLSIAIVSTYHDLRVRYELSQKDERRYSFDELQSLAKLLHPGGGATTPKTSFWARQDSEITLGTILSEFYSLNVNVTPDVPFTVMCHFSKEASSAESRMGLKLNGMAVDGSDGHIIAKGHGPQEGVVTWHIGTADAHGVRKVRMQCPISFSENDFGHAGKPAETISTVTISGRGPMNVHRISVFSLPI